MSDQTLPLDDHLHAYILAHALREHPAQAALRQETALLPAARMQVAPEQAQLLTLLVQMLGARNAIEIGVLAGYSALAIALGLPSDGHLLACETDPRLLPIAYRHWEAAGVRGRIDVRIGPASETLARLGHSMGPGSYDFVFIDADKRGYDTYYEHCLHLLRPGGVIAIDNVLWGGRVAAPARDAKAQSLHALNAKLHKDERVDLAIIPVGDGMTLLRKR